MGTVAITKQDDQQRTKVESCLLRKGTLLVKVFHNVGNMVGQYNSSLAVSTLRLIEPTNEASVSEGIRVEVQSREQDHTSFLDMDEVDSLLVALDYMIACLARVEHYEGDYMEFVFSTRGDFSVGFYIEKGKTNAFVKSAYNQAFLSSAALGQLSTLIRAGQSYLLSMPPFRVA